ncbi:MAG: DUF2341 domain-containing protein [Planctomycetota bacterium]|nr:DUF2341 domain-containing protein [Planctomycetota bacterium]
MKPISSTNSLRALVLFFCAVVIPLIVSLPGAAADQPAIDSRNYRDWKHSGSFFLLTTPEGADLPADTSVEEFPVLVRLHTDFFDFRQAKSHGEDVRFSSGTGERLAYQIEEWDAAGGTASIWVRIPKIQGNARQSIQLHWGNPDAKSESNGRGVFNSSNGYLGVFHMNDPVTDETGTLETKDTGTTEVRGMVGSARHFPGGRGVFCGDKITGFPTGSSPNTTTAWIRSEEANARVLGWGNEAPQGKVILNFRSPPHIRMECYFSGADVASRTPVRKSEWIHVVHTYEKGESLLYVNGVLDGASKTASAPLAIKSPARMWIGGWYDVYDFSGDVDEVRIANVVRSADWARLEYENQKPLQTLVGPVVRSGDVFSVSAERLDVTEGQSATVSAEAGGAQKVYWILQRGGKNKVVAVDRLNYSFDAGRVAGDETAKLTFKAIYANEIKTRDIAIAIREVLPEPKFTLSAPNAWDGRRTIEVAAQISNLAAMREKGVGDVKVHWAATGVPVIKTEGDGKLILSRSQNSGKLTVTATISNGGQAVTQTFEIAVQEPPHDAWVVRTPDKDEKPVDGQFYARDDKNEGMLHYNGALTQAADEVFLKLYADDELITTFSQKPQADRSYAFAVKLKPGLIRYRVELGTKNGGVETVQETADNLVCGDAYLIEGQSNAVATDWAGEKSEEPSEWIRSFGSLGGDGAKGWGTAVRREGGHWQIGYWGMDLARHLVDAYQVPVCIINGAVGGTRIDQHQPNPNDPADQRTIFGRWLKRVQQARLTHGIRGVLWHQGEADQGADGPDGGYGSATYEQYFLDMAAAWKQHLPNIQHYYLFQIWPNACSQGGTRHSDMLRDVQRRLPRLFSHMSVMSTVGIKPEGPCHYPTDGYAEMARLLIPLVERDNYGKRFDKPITAADLKSARYSSDRRDEIVLEFDQPMAWEDSVASQFSLDGAEVKVQSGSASGVNITLKLPAPSEATTITYLVDRRWNPNALLYGRNGIAALTFCEVPIAPAKTANR